MKQSRNQTFDPKHVEASMKALKYITFFILLLFFSACSGKDNKKIALAILTPATHPSLEQVEKGFKNTIEAQYPGQYRFVTYNAQGNKTLMRTEIEEIVQKKHPLVFTIGTMASQMVTEVFGKKKLHTPVVFTCVNDPVQFHIVSSEEVPGGYVTGVKELVDFRKELELILQLKPAIKKILLVLNPMQPGLIKDQKEVAVILKEKGIELIVAEVFQTNELMLKVSPLMSLVDALLVLKDNTIVGALDTLVKLSCQYHVPLVTSDLDSPDRGAAFGYGVHEVEFGVEGAKKALQILRENVKPGDIPVTPVSTFTFTVNLDAAFAQGINPELLVKREIR